MKRSRDQQIEYNSKRGQKRHLNTVARRGKIYTSAGASDNFNIPTEEKTELTYSTSLNHLIDSIRNKSYLNNPRRQVSYKLTVPEYFSLSERPKESYAFLFKLISVLHHQAAGAIQIDYINCKKIDIDAQVILDIVLKDFISFFNSSKARNRRIKIFGINAINVNSEDVQKILFSIGSNKILKNIEVSYPDIIPYHLCINNKERKGDPVEIASQKAIDTTNLVDHILACLKKVERELTPEALSDLCQVVGEILTNAEDHSTLKYRYSIGFFQDINEDGNHHGIINLVILNFGQTIYEKFKDPSCPTQHIVKRMQELSANYTKKNFFSFRDFEEETLWTMYALQEGVTTNADYKKRGNGSIRFIESFFNLRGNNCLDDQISKLTILSGNCKITIDGSYQTVEKVSGENIFKVIAFNQSGEIEEKPDKKFVTFVDNYFPGTLIFAKILVREDDVLAIKRA